MPHVPQVLHREASQSRLHACQVLRQAVHNALAPVSRCQLRVDVLAYPPVQTNELSFHSLVDALPRRTNQMHHLAERRLNGHVHSRA